MSLRTRLTMAVALLVAVAIGVTGWVVVLSARTELYDGVDAFLRERVERLAPFDIGGQRQPRGPGRGDFGRERFSEDDALTQVVTAEGLVLGLGGTPVPVSPADLAIAEGSAPARIRTVEVDGTDHRVITAPLGRRPAAVMVARNLSEVDAALAGLTRRTVAVGVAGTAVAGLLAWLLASRLSHPVKRLTRAAEHVARTQDLSATIDARGDDEVARLAASFNTMLEALDTSRRQQQRLVMDASHELRTPLTSLRTNIDLLHRAGTLDDHARAEVLDDVREELEELSTLVTELVELSTSSRRPTEPVTEVGLASLADAVADRARRRFGREVEVVVARDAEVPGRRALLERAVWNLVDNAVKFSDAGSPVVIEVDRGRVVVRDRGPGIPAEDRPHIFDRFYRAGATRAAPGSGLGLSIVADIVRAHDGELLVEEAEGGGAAIGFSLPTPT